MRREKQGADITSGDMVSDAALLAQRQRIWIGAFGGPLLKGKATRAILRRATAVALTHAANIGI